MRQALEIVAAEQILAVVALAAPIGRVGTSIEDQATADARIPHLLATPAAARFVSAEPLLGALDLRITQARGSSRVLNALTGMSFSETSLSALPRGPGLDLVIVGGESGPRARPMHSDWVRSLRDHCVSAGVSFHFKQWGEWMFQSPEGRATGFYRVGKKAAGRLLDGRTWDERPGARACRGARQARSSNEPPASASSRIPDATGRGQPSTGATDG
nr:DUF5131 family protein [Rhodobacter capsulatus]